MQVENWSNNSPECVTFAEEYVWIAIIIKIRARRRLHDENNKKGGKLFYVCWMRSHDYRVRAHYIMNISDDEDDINKDVPDASHRTVISFKVSDTIVLHFDRAVLFVCRFIAHVLLYGCCIDGYWFSCVMKSKILFGFVEYFVVYSETCRQCYFSITENNKVKCAYAYTWRNLSLQAIETSNTFNQRHTNTSKSTTLMVMMTSPELLVQWQWDASECNLHIQFDTVICFLSIVYGIHKISSLVDFIAPDMRGAI